MKLIRIVHYLTTFVFLALCVAHHVFADSLQRKIDIETEQNVLSLFVDQDGRVHQNFYGSKTDQRRKSKPVGEVYPCSGGDYVKEPALRIVHADGNTSTLLVYQSHEAKQIDENQIETRIVMKDSHYPLYVTLVYRAFQHENLIAASTIIQNKEAGPVTVYNYASQTLLFKENPYHLTQFHGTWNNEANMVTEALTPGIKVLDSKRGVRAHEMRSPFYLLSSNDRLSETQGEVIGATLAWSGSFQFAFEVDENNTLSVVNGVHPFASQIILKPEESLSTPEMLTVYSNTGTSPMSRGFHHWARHHGMRDGTTPRSILLNNWEATFFDFDHGKLTKLFRGAKEAGFELFLLDDGWFGNKHPRNDDTRGLGDWQANVKKLPKGVEGLCEEAEKIGIPFGIWVEPEMLNPKSELYEKHPDWAIRQPFRRLHLFRNQLILDLTNPNVKEFSYNVTANLLKKNPYISFIKWDANRYVSNGGSAYLSPEQQSELIWRYHEALYDNMDKTAREFPHVRMMLCSGGGGRVDYKALSYFHEFWPSDNTNPLKRVFIQWGFSYFYPAISQASHVTSAGDSGIKFAFDVAMSARLGMDYDLAKMSKEDFKLTQNAIADYKAIRKTVQLGDQYRLISPYGNSRCSLMYIDEKRTNAVFFFFQIENDTEGTNVLLQGLDPDATYSVKEINVDKVRDWVVASATGKHLMDNGMDVPLKNKNESVVLVLEHR